jgi:hypothetical protein
MSQNEKTKVTQVCKCEKCGNEAEMVITCTLQDERIEADAAKKAAVPEHKHVKGIGTCGHCGNEAEMWVDI